MHTVLVWSFWSPPGHLLLFESFIVQNVQGLLPAERKLTKWTFRLVEILTQSLKTSNAVSFLDHMNDAVDDKGIVTISITGHTPLQFGNVFWPELLWLVWNRYIMNIILESSDVLKYNDFFSKLCGHNGHSSTCDYAALDNATFVVMSIVAVCILMLQNLEYFSYGDPTLCNIYGTLILSNQVCINNLDPTLHYTPLGSVCLYWCTTQHEIAFSLDVVTF